jgi:hypothetical protein
MDESAYSTLLKYVENTEYTENLTENEKRKLRKLLFRRSLFVLGLVCSLAVVYCASVTAAFSLSYSATFLEIHLYNI